jgi:low affinity Fe/Cu permease
MVAQRQMGGFERIAHRFTRLTGSSTAFALATGVVVVWLLTGPVFRFSDTWQLVINTGTTIVTFLMVFLIQQTQNKDGLAVQLKLNELVASQEGASNRLIAVESLTEEELRVLSRHYDRLAQMAREEADIRASHSIDEAERRHNAKTRAPHARTPAAETLRPKKKKKK